MNHQIEALRETRAKAVADARAIVERAGSEKRSLNDSEKQQYDGYMADALRHKEDIERLEKLVEEERALASASARSAVNRPGQQGAPDAEARMAAFRSVILGAAGADEFRALTAGTDVSAGFLNAPQEFVAQVIAKVKDICFVRGKATVYPVTSPDGLGIPSLETDPADADWSEEITAFAEDTTMAFGKRELRPHPLKKLVKISDKLLRGAAVNPETIVMDRVAYKFGVTEEKAFLTGSGNKQPLGVFTASAAGINTDRDFGAADNAATAITFDGLIATKYGLKAQYQGKAEWLFHRDAMKMIAQLKDGDGQYIWQPSLIAGQPDLLLGRPIMMSEYAPNTFTAGLYVGIFADFSWYWIADSLNLRIKRLNELYAATSQVGFIFDKETDGMPVLSEAFARVKLGA